MHNYRSSLFLFGSLLAFASLTCVAQVTPGTIGQFEAQQDVGTVLHAGSVNYDVTAKTYTITGSGDNVWSKSDDLHFVWKKVQPNYEVVLSAQIDFANGGGNPHKKAMLMIRQSLDPDSAYVDVARHGNGLTSLQYRDAPGDVTREIELNVSGPPKVRIARSGNDFFVWYAGADGKWMFSGASMTLPMKDPYYVGLGVCSHDKDVSETAIFSKVQLLTVPDVVAVEKNGTWYSTLEVVPIASTDRRVVYVAATNFEAPTWLKDNSGFLVNADGHVELIGAEGEAPVPAAKSAQTSDKSDRVVSPDGKWVVTVKEGADHNLQGAMLQLTSLADGKTSLLAKMTARHGTITSSSWSTDSTQVAFVDYALVPDVDGWE